MRKECKTLHMKAVDSLVLAVDHFNRAWDRGRTEAVLILLDRAFELLVKAIIVHRAGGDAIREKKKEGMTIGFDLCLRKCLSDTDLKCLNEDEVVALQSLNTLRDAAQHYMVELSEEHLYVYAQAALTLFGRLTREVLERPLARLIMAGQTQRFWLHQVPKMAATVAPRVNLTFRHMMPSPSPSS